MKRPSRVAKGDAITAAAWNTLVDAVNGDRITSVVGGMLKESPNGAAIVIDSAKGAKASGGSVAASAHPFKVEPVAITPTPNSGALETLTIYAGRVNGTLATINGSTPLEGVSVSLPSAGMLTTGAYWYVYAEVRQGTPRPVIKCAQYTPLDSGGVRYITIAGVRAMTSGATYSWQVLQYVDGDIECDFPLGFECDLVRENGISYLDMKGGAVTIATQNWAHAELFDNNAHRIGAKRFDHPSFESLKVAAGASSMSLWVAYEYPRKGTALPAADWGKLKLTATQMMPTNRPWVVVAESNANANASQANSGTGESPPTPGTEDQTGEADTVGANPDAAFDKIAPPAGDWTSFTDSDASPVTTNGTYSGPLGTVEWTKQTVARTRTWTKAGSTVKVATLNFTSSFFVSNITRFDTASHTNENPATISNLVALGYVMNPGDDIWAKGYKWRTWGTAGPYLTGLTTDTNSGSTGYLISGGVQIARVKMFRTHGEGVAVHVNGEGGRIESRTLPEEIDWFYGDAVGSTGDTEDPANKSDGSDEDAKGDRPGRPPRGNGIASPPLPGETTQGATSGGAAITTAGPGLWVYEIARISTTGVLTQCHTGDIVLHPAPQVCVRTNPKITALP